MVIDELLTELGFDWSTAFVNEFYIRGQTFCHDGDNPTGFIYYHNMNRWSCFTNGCHKKYHGDPIGLIRSVLSVSFPHAVKVAEKFLEQHKISSKKIAQAIRKREEAQRKVRQDAWANHRNQRTFSETALERLCSPAAFCRHRQFNPALFQDYKIGYAKTGKMVGRVVVPIRNVHGRLVGFSGRIVNPKQSPCKWLHFGFERSINFFNLDNAFDYLCETGKRSIVLVEGPFDALKLVEAGVKNTVAILGDALTPGQVEVLKKIGVSKIWLALDGDSAGAKATPNIQKFLEKEMLDVGIIRVEDELSDTVSLNWDTSWGSPDWGHLKVTTDIIQRIFAGRSV